MKKIIGALFGVLVSNLALAAPPASSIVSGSVSATTTAAATIIPAPTIGSHLYIGSIQCGRTDAGTTAMYVTLNDNANTVIVLPNSGGGGGNNITFNPALVVSPNLALTFKESTNTNTVYCSAQGTQG